MPLTADNNPWRAHVARSFNMRDAEIVLARVSYRNNVYVTSLQSGEPATVREVAEGAMWPDPLRLPVDAIEPLRDALDEFLGKPKDDYRSKYEEARDALAVERRRVDDLLAQVGRLPA